MKASKSSGLPMNAARTTRSRRATRYWLAVLGALSVVLTACATIDSGPTSVFGADGDYNKARQADTPWAVLPIANHTETVNAGQRAASIATSFLSSQGFKNVRQYPESSGEDALFEPAEAEVLDKAKQWAQRNKLHYALTGAVNEWRYKVGVDGEPAIGIMLQVIDVDTDTVIWSGLASKTGWSREAAAAVAQELVKELLVPVVGPAATRSPS